MAWREIALRRNPDCPVCGDVPTQTALIDYELFCGLKPPSGGNAEAARGFEELDASSVAGLLKSETPPYLIDVREPWEWAVSSLADRGARLIPLGELGARLGEVPKETPVVVYCRSGQRSRDAARELVAAGYGPVTNLSGGLLSWAESVDPDLPVV